MLPVTMTAKYNLLKTGGRCITQRAKMSIDPKFVELTADVVRTSLYNYHDLGDYINTNNSIT